MHALVAFTPTCLNCREAPRWVNSLVECSRLLLHILKRHKNTMREPILITRQRNIKLSEYSISAGNQTRRSPNHFINFVCLAVPALSEWCIILCNNSEWENRMSKKVLHISRKYKQANKPNKQTSKQAKQEENQQQQLGMYRPTQKWSGDVRWGQVNSEMVGLGRGNRQRGIKLCKTDNSD